MSERFYTASAKDTLMASAGVRQGQLSSVIGNPSHRQAAVRRKVPPATSDSAQIRKLQDAPRVSLRGEMWAILTCAEQDRSAVCWLLAKAAALVLQADLLRTRVA